MIIQRKINISLKGNTLPMPVRVVEADNVYQLILKYIDFDIPEGAVATMFVKKPSGKFVYQEDNISIEGNVVTIDVDNQAIIEDGISPFQVELKKDGKILTTFINYFSVEKNLKNPNAEESKTVIKAFDELIAEKIEEMLEEFRAAVKDNVTAEALVQAVEEYLLEHPITGGTVSDEQIANAVEAYLLKNPITGVSSEQIAQAVADYLTKHPVSGGGGANITVDNKLSETSENPVQNKVVTKKINLLSEQIVELKENTESTQQFPIAKCLFRYAGADIGDSIQRSIEVLSGYDLAVFDGALNKWYASTTEQQNKERNIIEQAKLLNPNLKVFMYMTVASEHNGYTLEADGTWNDENPVSKIHTRAELTEMMERLYHVGGTVTRDSSGKNVYSGGIKFDGVFFDEFDTDNSTGLKNQGGWTSIIEKQNELVNEAHALGLSVFANPWFVINAVSGNVVTTSNYNPNGIRPALDERDFVLFESNEYYPGVGDNTTTMTWSTYSISDRVFDYITNYYDSCGAKAVSYSYGGSNWSQEECQIALTWMLYNSLAMGAHYVYFGGMMDWTIPENVLLFTPKEGEKVVRTKIETGKYQLDCNGHTLQTYRYTRNTNDVEVNISTLKQTLVTIDGVRFQNAYIDAPTYSYQTAERLESVEEALYELENSKKQMANPYVRTLIDDWIPKPSPQDYTNIIPDKDGSNNLLNVSKRDGYNVSGTVGNSWGSYRWNMDATPYAGKILELGCSSFTVDTTSHTFGIYVFVDDNWSNSIIIWEDTLNDSAIGNESRININFVVPENASTITVGFWATGASETATWSVTNLYLVDITEIEEYNAKDWYTNRINKVNDWRDYRIWENGEKPYTVTVNDDHSLTLTFNENNYSSWHGIEIPCDNTPELFTTGSHYEFGCNGISSNADSNIRMRIFTNRGYSNWFVPTTRNESSAYDGEKKACMEIYTSEATMDSCTYCNIQIINIANTPYNIGSNGEKEYHSITINGLYLYDLDEEDIVIRGRNPANTWLQICRVTEEKLASDTTLQRNALYITDIGNMFITDYSGNRTDIIRKN